VTLGVADAQVRESRERKAESERNESVAMMVSKASAATEQVDRWGAGGFSGRWRKGPEEAAIRIVMLTDYQCPDCKRLETEAEELFKSRKDLSLAIKHFPMCKDAAPGVPCNKYITRTLHQNACWGARAAEAAGILAGDDGFFKMHDWLFSRGGSFTDAELKAALPALGFDPTSFVAVMSGPETLRRVQADIEDGIALGLNYTPMIFVNGVELKGWNVPKAITKTVEQVAAANPPPRTASADRPVLAATKYIEDWREQRARPMPPEKTVRALGADATAAKVLVVVFGDLQEENTARIDEEIRDALRTLPSARYIFRHFPVCKDCNPTLPAQVPEASLHPMACKAASAAEAAGGIAGNDGYWKMHTWLLKNRQGLTDEKIRAGARELGFDAAALDAAMGRPDVKAAISEDAVSGSGMGFTGIPAVYVNGKWVPRTYREGDRVVARIMEEAAKGR
jgi:protein-disulfide isomerase